MENLYDGAYVEQHVLIWRHVHIM